MSTQTHIAHEPYKDEKHRVAIVYRGTTQETQVLVAKGTNPAGEPNWVAASTPEEYQAVIDAWAKKAYRDYTDEMDRRHPRGGPDDR